MHDLLLTLALRACTDREAQPVLGDAVLEAGWWDSRVMPMVLGQSSVRRRFYQPHGHLTNARNRNLFFKRAGKPDRRWCQAVAAALLFGWWTETRWATCELAIDVYRTAFEAEWVGAENQFMRQMSVFLYGGQGQVSIDDQNNFEMGMSVWVTGSDGAGTLGYVDRSMTTQALREEPPEAYEAPPGHSLSEIAAEVALMQRRAARPDR